MIAIYTVIFGRVMSARHAALGDSTMAYVIYLVSGLLPWNAFTEMLLRGTRGFLEQSSMIKKMEFPMEVVQTTVAGSVTINFAISYAVFLLVTVAFGYVPTWHILLVPIVYVFQLFLAVGLAHFTSILNVFFRDTESMVGIITQVWFWVTPIIYLESIVPEWAHWLFWINPMYYFIRIYHDLVFGHMLPAPEMIAGAVGFAVTAFVLGSSFFCRFKVEVPDEI